MVKASDNLFSEGFTNELVLYGDRKCKTMAIDFGTISLNEHWTHNFYVVYWLFFLFLCPRVHMYIARIDYFFLTNKALFERIYTDSRFGEIILFFIIINDILMFSLTWIPFFSIM